jgi:adenosylmethionine-8-amino-7-oxononanoate aminotransferase
MNASAETVTRPNTANSPGGGQSAFYATSSITPLPVIERAEGVYFWDDEGRRYMDVSSGPVISNIGHGNSRVAKAMADQAIKLEYVFARLARNPVNIEYSERLARLAGPGFERVSLASGGSEAVENAIKFLRQYALATGKPAKTQVITCQPSYHGATIATLAMNGEITMAPFFEGFAVTSHKVPAPLSYRLPDGYDVVGYARYCAEALNAKIEELGADNVLAFVFEPVGGLSTGCVVPPGEYIHAIRDICTRHGVHLVFDEIICGMGRTGKFLAAHHWPNALPDIITMAKGLASGYSPLGAMLAPAAMVDDLAGLTGFEFQYSYNANPVSCAVGMAVLDEYESHDLVACAVERGAQLRSGLEALRSRLPIIGDIRGLGMLMAVELVADKETRASLPNDIMPTDKVRIHGLNNGLLIYSRPASGGKYGHWFIVAPPLTISEEECDELLHRLGDTMNDLVEDLTKSAAR